uniref:Uncharacterized protein n=1 Tax=Sinocyclocheilus grahami TaxID=75366 RepID=A0A672M2G1_SINGR
MFIVKSAVKDLLDSTLMDFLGESERVSGDFYCVMHRKREVCAIMADSRGVLPALPKHSYWFDFWMFLLFDVVLFLIFYFVLP